MLNIPLADPLPDGIRVASLVGTATQYPIVVANDRFLLWGFEGLPGDMTVTGTDLFINALSFLVSGMKLPIKGADAVQGAGYDQAFIDELGEGGVPLHAFVQLYHIPSPLERSTLTSKGVTLQTYLGSTFYAALIAPSFNPDDAFIQGIIRWLGGTNPVLKVNPELNGTSLQADVAPEIPTLLVTFFDDITIDEAAKILAKYTDVATYHNHPIWQVPRTAPIIAGLSTEESVRWIDFGPPPELDANDTGRASTGAEIVQNAQVPAAGLLTYLGLTGSGVVIAHFEDDADSTHTDLSPRVAIGAGTTGGADSHATHVNGIMIGSGVDSINQGGTNYQWRGHAPEASTVSEGYGSGNADSHGDAILNYGAELSNHSYVLSYGVYDADNVSVDTIIRGDATTSGGDAVPPHLAVWAACNQGMWAQYNNEEGFYSIYSPAKNLLSVGSIDSNDGELSLFSSKGPTFDGRIKPDVMAPGSNQWNAAADTATGINSTENGGAYTGKSGTSMAAPATTGVLALVLEQYHLNHGWGTTPLPATLKAILVNTADDMVKTVSDGSDDNDRDLCRAQGVGGTALDESDPLDPDCWVPYGPGPDFATGYGAINAVNAVATMRGDMWVEGELSPADDTETWTFTIPAGRDELRFTLAWDDEPGNSAAPNTTIQLVNDLDLRLIAPDTTVNFPFTLAPLPANATLGNGGLDPIDHADITDAFRGDDDRNNVEQVLVENPAAGTWTVQVTIEGGFPTGNPQSFGLVGDARNLNIVEPQTGNEAEAGDPANPNVILVVIEAENALDGAASTLVDAQVTDFTVEIEGTPADIVSGLPVGDQFWLNVLAQSGVYSAGSKYDLTVTWDGYGEDQENNSVLFTEREVTDRAVIVDSSGSMGSYDKMASAQNAARLFIDQSLTGDRIAVVEFDNTASTPYGITEVSANPATPELNAAKAAVDAMSVGGTTAIGQGLLAGQAEVTATPAAFSVADVLILLSDGMENVNPFYDTVSVKGVIEPTDTIIHTVAVGPANAGHHDLLDTIASQNGGESYHVNTTSTALAVAGEPNAVTAGGTGIDAWPMTLPNRLGDAYKQIAEAMLGETRLFQAFDLSDPKGGDDVYMVEVPDGLTRVTFTLNWELASNMLRLILKDPKGNTYEYDPLKPAEFCRGDTTHESCIIPKPEPGLWSVSVRFLEASTTNEYVVWASAKTAVNFKLAIGTPVNRRIAGEPILILGFLNQAGKPLEGKIAINVFPPQGETEGPFELFDDGAHGDGKKGDGIYGMYYMSGYRNGPFAVRGTAQGDDALGKPFVLYDNLNFHIKPRVLYVYDYDVTKAMAYEKLLEMHSLAVDLAFKGAVPLLNLRPYSLVIIGPDTGSMGTWTPQAAIDAITRNEIPVLGLGEGGYAFFGKRNAAIGFPHGAHGSGKAILANHSTASDLIWQYPYDLLNLPKEAWALYTDNNGRVSIYLGQAVGVKVFGFNDTNQNYADLIMESNWFMLWGFNAGPSLMTDSGKQLFVNTVYRTLQ